MTGFKNFVMRGNLVELAVAVVIGTQFSSLVKQFVSSFIDPLLSLVGGTPDLGKLVLHVGKATFTYGQFLTEALTFLISALVVYYAMVLPVSRLLKLLDRNEAATSRDCPECTIEHRAGHRAAPASSSRTAARLPGPERHETGHSLRQDVHQGSGFMASAPKGGWLVITCRSRVAGNP